MNYILESIKNILGENSIGWRKVKKNHDVLEETKNWLKENKEYEKVLKKIQEFEEKL